jgi:hypothetical protein
MSDLLFSLSLRLWHPTLAAVDLTSRFDLEVEVSHSVNERRRTPKGTLLDGVYPQTYCCLSLKKSGKSRLDRHLNSWCEYLEKRISFLREFVRTGGKLEFYVSIFLDGDKGFEVNSALAQRICTLGLGFSVEIYRLTDTEAGG